MTIQDLRNLDREEVLGWLGLELKDSTGARLAKTLGVLTAGVLAGGCIALLLAPKAGNELRDDLRERLRQMGETNGARRGHKDRSSAGSPA